MGVFPNILGRTAFFFLFLRLTRVFSICIFLFFSSSSSSKFINYLGIFITYLSISPFNYLSFLLSSSSSSSYPYAYLLKNQIFTTIIFHGFFLHILGLFLIFFRFLVNINYFKFTLSILPCNALSLFLFSMSNCSILVPSDIIINFKLFI